MACQASQPDVPNRTRLVVLIERGRGVFAVVAVAPTGPMPAQADTLVGSTDRTLSGALVAGNPEEKG